MQNPINQKEAIFQQIAAQLRIQGFRISQQDESRPWGGFFVIDEDQA
jgi:mannose-6-phosphate isomerase